MKRILLVAIALLCSCHKKQSSHTKNVSTQSQHHEAAFSFVSEAKNVDIPVPLSFIAAQHDSAEKTEYFVYQGQLLIDQVKLFYLQEMERLGWSITDFVCSSEVMLFCKKASKKCLLSIRPLSRPGKFKTELTVFIKTVGDKYSSDERD